MFFFEDAFFTSLSLHFFEVFVIDVYSDKNETKLFLAFFNYEKKLMATHSARFCFNIK